jgi:two-component system, NarL family, sensor histidine kinase DegS
MVIYSAWPWRHWSFNPNLLEWFPWLIGLYNIALFEVTFRIVGVLFLAPIIYAALVFTWPGALAICLISLARVVPFIVDMSYNFLVVNIILLMLPFLLILAATMEFQWHRKERKVFIEREEERRTYISNILESQEKERQRIARDIHDETIQTLLAVANNAEIIVSSGDITADDAKKKAKWIRDTTINTVNSLRTICLELRPSILDNLGLIPALRWLTDSMNKDCNIHSQVLVKGLERKLLPQVEASIYRIIQEALNNIKRHSKAKISFIVLDYYPEYLKIVIRDDGQGFHSPKAIDSFAGQNKLGLIGIQERINYLKGSFRLLSKPGKGTMLLIKLQC